jgi:hypothetical protein
MKISKSMLSKICVTAGFLVLAQLSFATGTITIRKGDPIPPPDPMPARVTIDTEIPVSATIDSTELAMYFEWSVGEATITVYDEYSNVVYQGVVDTDTDLSTSIPSGSWSAGSYTLTISYGTENLIGDFQME